jgi:hypothetical protein
MKIFKSALLALGTSLIGTTLLTMSASAIDFGFSFQNALNDTENGTVTGVIRGLEEGTGAATSVEVFSNTAGYGIGEYVGSPDSNVWTVLNGNIVTFDFLSFGEFNTSPAVTDASLFFNSHRSFNALFVAGISPFPGLVVSGDINLTTEDINLTFNRLDDGIKSVPEPTSILSLLLVGAAVIGTTLKHKQT